MAVTALNLTSGAGSGTSANTASISPAANKLILVSVRNGLAGTPNEPTITGASMTWVKIATAFDGVNNRVTIFRGLSASPSSGALTIDCGGQSQSAIGWSVDQFTGIDISGTNGSGAIVQSNTATLNGSASSITVTLSAFGSSNNATYGAAFWGPEGPTAGANFTSLAGASNMTAQWANNPQTSVNWTFGSNSSQGDAVAVEIKIVSTPSGSFQFL